MALLYIFCKSLISGLVENSISYKLLHSIYCDICHVAFGKSKMQSQHYYENNFDLAYFSREHTLRTTVLKDCYIGGPVMDKAFPCRDELALEDELTPCGICPSPKLKRHAFHTLSPEALSGRPFGLGNQEKACGAMSQLTVSRVAPAPWGRVGTGSQECSLRICALILGHALW